jgi:hypothetical protein
MDIRAQAGPGRGEKGTRASYKSEATNLLRKSYKYTIIFNKYFKRLEFLSNKYQWKAKNNKSIIKLNGIPTSLLACKNIFADPLYQRPGANGPVVPPHPTFPRMGLITNNFFFCKEPAMRYFVLLTDIFVRLY